MSNSNKTIVIFQIFGPSGHCLRKLQVKQVQGILGELKWVGLM